MNVSLGGVKMFEEIKGSSTWKSVEKIDKGWSNDIKYMVITEYEEKLLLRISDISKFEAKKKEYKIISKFSKQGFKMSMPVEFGTCNNAQNVYILLTWLDGSDLEQALPMLSENEQYNIGFGAGKILKNLHSIRVDEIDIPHETRLNKKMLQLKIYEESDFRIANDEIALKYVRDNVHLICREKPVYLHGDFHPGNLIYMKDGSIGVIDFNRWFVGDPYEEFYKLQSFAREISVPYCIGQIDAYFGDDIPQEFWQTLAVYVAHSSLYSIKWAEKFGQKDVDKMKQRCLEAFEDYDYFKNIVPIWYRQYNKFKVHFSK